MSKSSLLGYVSTSNQKSSETIPLLRMPMKFSNFSPNYRLRNSADVRIHKDPNVLFIFWEASLSICIFCNRSILFINRILLGAGEVNY